MVGNIIQERYVLALLEDLLQYNYQDVLDNSENKLQRKKKIE
jgi:hypothetical protein